MKKKLISIFITIFVLLSVITAAELCAPAQDGTVDNSALLAAFDKVSCYDEADYTAESYGALSALNAQYQSEYESYTTQEQTDAATASLLEAICDLRAYLSLTVTADNNAQIGVSYGETTAGAGKQTVVYGTSVSLSAPEIEGYTFGGWYETTSKRILSSGRNYTFTMTVKTALRAVYYSNSQSSLTFKSYSGQIVSVTEKTAEAWAEYESLESLTPAVPYRFGYTNGRWNVPSDALGRLISGESVTVTPEYDAANEGSFAPPSATSDVSLKLYYRHDVQNSVGSFVMTTAIPQGVTPEAVGMIFYNKKAADFNPSEFDVNINNKMLASQFDTVNDEKYITNINHLSSKYNWAVKGYASYYSNGKLVTVYSNQVNIVNTEDVHVLQAIAATEPTCTESGNTAGTYCDVCGKYFGVEEIAALGHDYNSVVTEPTCTAAGFTTHTCSRCGDSYTDNEVSSLGHEWGDIEYTWATDNKSATAQRSCTRTGCTESFSETVKTTSQITKEPTCTEAGETTYSALFTNKSFAPQFKTVADIPALGHNYEAVVTAPTCTAAGYTTYTCSRCNDSYTGDEVAPLGHNYESVVTAPTCTTAGYTTYTCSRCNDSYTGNETAALGHNYGNWAVTTGATLTTDGVETKTCANDSSHTQTRTISHFTLKLPNTGSYLYRVGNANNVKLGTLFDSASGADITSVSATVTNIAGSASGTYTANSSDWRLSTIKFNNTGVVTVTLKHGSNSAATLKLEVVAGTNYVEGATLGSITSNNAVLLGNVNSNTSRTSAITINNNKTLYGNGFSVTDVRTSTAGTSGYINMSGGGAIDNAVLLGKVYSSAVSSGTDNENYAPGIWITGNASIYNSRVSECKYAVQVDGGDVTLENSTFDGGAIANVCIGGGNVTLKNCTTSSSVRGGLNGLGIRVTTSSCKINLEGSLTQYNWLKKADLPSTYSSVLSSIYNDSNYAYSYSGSTYVNMGLFFITDASSITQALASEAINDNTSNNYGYIEKTTAGITGTIYTAKSSMGSASMLTTPAYTPVTNGQYYTLPTASFNYTMNDFSTDDTTYCTYNSTTKTTNISFVLGSSVSWNSSILTVTKNGNTLPYTVTMNNTDYTGQSITFDTAGDYEVVYSYTDPYNYDKNGTAFNHTYTKTVNIHVTTVEQGTTVYHPDFTYANIGGTTASKQVTATVSGANRVYVMPDVSSTSSGIESKTVGGKTIYYPVVTVNSANSSGGSYSSGKIYYFAPAFKYINIVDYDQSNQTTKTAQYTYNTSTQKWPHNISGSSKPDTNYYYYTATNTSSNTNRPYGRSMNEQYYTYQYNSSCGGLCYLSKDIEKDNSANSQLVEFYYKGTDDVTYYYYIKYSFTAQTYSSCVAEGSLVTMADGTQKPIEDVHQGDMVMTWSMWNGRYEAQPVALAYYHGKQDWDVLTLNFSDGTDVRMINQHGFFDVDKNTYAYITPSNVSQYIGDRFIKQLPDGSNTEVTLTDYEISEENVGCYSLQTAYNENFMVENMLSMTGEDYTGRFEYFDIGEGMKYDEAKMQSDIDRYGLYTYEDWSDYLTPEQFEMFNGKYFKILVGKGVFTEEDILKIINTNL